MPIEDHDGILINTDIPYTMTIEGMRYLGELARSVPEDGLIVEIGPLFGASTWVLAKNSKPSVRIVSVDTWEPAAWIDKIEAKFPGCKPFGLEAFAHYVSDCDNVEAKQGWSPAIVKDMNLDNINLFFDDATHGDPGFSESLAYYVPRVVEGGIVCGDDYAGGWPDIVKRVDELASAWGLEPEVAGRLWALIKPKSGQPPQRVAAAIGSPAGITVSVRYASGRQTTSSPRRWTAGLHKPDPIVALRIDGSEAMAGVEVQAQLEGSDRSPWTSSGQWLEMPGGMTSIRLRHGLGSDDQNDTVRYQVSAAVQNGDSIQSENSRSFSADQWAATADVRRLTAIRVF